jgi:hypothetical protein
MNRRYLAQIVAGSTRTNEFWKIEPTMPLNKNGNTSIEGVYELRTEDWRMVTKPCPKVNWKNKEWKVTTYKVSYFDGRPSSFVNLE